MVGVPGRSKGCNTCRQRKIACGQQKPQCAQCIKSDRVCMGYQRERIFIPNHSAGQEGPKIYTRQAPSKIHTSPLTGLEKGRVNLSSRKKEHANTRSTDSSASQAVIIQTVSPHLVYRQQLLSSFLIRDRLAADSTIRPYDADEGRPAAWLRHLPELATLTEALELSILAVCTAKFGRSDNDPMLVDNSQRFYVQGLSELQKALWDSTLMRKDETLAACMVLSLYEAIECPAKTRYGWMSHVKGCAKLIRLRGPEAHASALGHELFLSFRFREITQAITQRRSTYLSDPKWMEVPWSNFPKTPFHQFLDIMVALPGIIEQGYHMRGLTSPSRLLTVLGIIDSCWKMDAKLIQFYKELEKKSLGPLYWPELSKEENLADDMQLGKVFPVAFHFLNPRTAHICILYWATLIILWSGLSYMYKRLANMKIDEILKNVTHCSDDNRSSASNEDAVCTHKDQARKLRLALSDVKHHPPLGHRLDIVSIGRNICQSLEYCLQAELRRPGPGLAYFPLKVAIETFNDHPNCSRELLWAKSTMEKVGGRGIRLLKYLGVPVTYKTYLPV